METRRVRVAGRIDYCQWDRTGIDSSYWYIYYRQLYIICVQDAMPRPLSGLDLLA